ncbi:MAG: hypothetical protein LUD15_03575 [Bacteroides sp.]|nr:hypothetical protein [Bacteroides sp.]
MGLPCFKADGGPTYYVTNQDVSQLNGTRWWISVEYNGEQHEEQEGISPESQKYYVTLLGGACIDGEVNILTKGSQNDTLKTNPVVDIISVEGAAGYLNLGINYYIYERLHSLVLFNYLDGDDFKSSGVGSVPDTLNVYLSHDALDDKVDNYNAMLTKNTEAIFYYRSFDLRGIMDNLPARKDSIVLNVIATQSSSATLEEGSPYSVKVKVPTY